MSGNNTLIKKLRHGCSAVAAQALVDVGAGVNLETRDRVSAEQIYTAILRRKNDLEQHIKMSATGVAPGLGEGTENASRKITEAARALLISAAKTKN